MLVHLWDRETEVKNHSQVINGQVYYHDQSALLTFCGEWMRDEKVVGLYEPDQEFQPTCDACILMHFEREAKNGTTREDA